MTAAQEIAERLPSALSLNFKEKTVDEGALVLWSIPVALNVITLD